MLVELLFVACVVGALAIAIYFISVTSNNAPTGFRGLGGPTAIPQGNTTPFFAGENSGQIGDDRGTGGLDRTFEEAPVAVSEGNVTRLIASSSEFYNDRSGATEGSKIVYLLPAASVETTDTCLQACTTTLEANGKTQNDIVAVSLFPPVPFAKRACHCFSSSYTCSNLLSSAFGTFASKIRAYANRSCENNPIGGDGTIGDESECFVEEGFYLNSCRPGSPATRVPCTPCQEGEYKKGCGEDGTSQGQCVARTKCGNFQTSRINSEFRDTECVDLLCGANSEPNGTGGCTLCDNMETKQQQQLFGDAQTVRLLYESRMNKPVYFKNGKMGIINVPNTPPSGGIATELRQLGSNVSYYKIIDVSLTKGKIFSVKLPVGTLDQIAGQADVRLENSPSYKFVEAFIYNSGDDIYCP